jgi:hypothetical protein
MKRIFFIDFLRTFLLLSLCFSINCSFLSLFSKRRELSSGNSLIIPAATSKTKPNEPTANNPKEELNSESRSSTQNDFYLPEIKIDIETASTLLSQIVIDNMERYKYFINTHNLDFEKKCEIKQGHLNMIQKLDQTQGTNNVKLHVEPVFVVLNTETLSIFEIDKVETLKDTLKLQNIKPVLDKPRFMGSYCFNIDVALNVKLRTTVDAVPTLSSHYFCTESQEYIFDSPRDFCAVQ